MRVVPRNATPMRYGPKDTSFLTIDMKTNNHRTSSVNNAIRKIRFGHDSKWEIENAMTSSCKLPSAEKWLWQFRSIFTRLLTYHDDLARSMHTIRMIFTKKMIILFPMAKIQKEQPSAAVLQAVAGYSHSMVLDVQFSAVLVTINSALICCDFDWHITIPPTHWPATLCLTKNETPRTEAVTWLRPEDNNVFALVSGMVAAERAVDRWSQFKFTCEFNISLVPYVIFAWLNSDLVRILKNGRRLLNREFLRNWRVTAMNKNANTRSFLFTHH